MGLRNICYEYHLHRQTHHSKSKSYGTSFPILQITTQKNLSFLSLLSKSSIRKVFLLSSKNIVRKKVEKSVNQTPKKFICERFFSCLRSLYSSSPERQTDQLCQYKLVPLSLPPPHLSAFVSVSFTYMHVCVAHTHTDTHTEGKQPEEAFQMFILLWPTYH